LKLQFFASKMVGINLLSKEDAMSLDKKKYNIYLVSAIIGAGLLYMGISTWYIQKEVMSQTSVDLAIDRAVDQCWDQKKVNE